MNYAAWHVCFHSLDTFVEIHDIVLLSVPAVMHPTIEDRLANADGDDEWDGKYDEHDIDQQRLVNPSTMMNQMVYPPSSLKHIEAKALSCG